MLDIGNLYLYFELNSGIDLHEIKDSIKALLKKSGIVQFSIRTEELLIDEDFISVVAVRAIAKGEGFYKSPHWDEPLSLIEATKAFKITRIKSAYYDWQSGIKTLWSTPEEKPEL